MYNSLFILLTKQYTYFMKNQETCYKFSQLVDKRTESVHIFCKLAIITNMSYCGKHSKQRR